MLHAHISFTGCHSIVRNQVSTKWGQEGFSVFFLIWRRCPLPPRWMWEAVSEKPARPQASFKISKRYLCRMSHPKGPGLSAPWHVLNNTTVLSISNGMDNKFVTIAHTNEWFAFQVIHDERVYHNNVAASHGNDNETGYLFMCLLHYMYVSYPV